MFSELDIGNSIDDGHDMAIYVACKKFEELHPVEMQPNWLKYCMKMNVSKNQQGNWMVKLFITPKIQLEADEYLVWRKDGVPEFFKMDSVTGEKRFIISGGASSEPEIIFCVEVDFEEKKATVLIDAELDVLDETKYAFNIRY